MGVEGLLSIVHNVISTESEYFNIFIDGVGDQVFSLQTEQLNDVVQTISSLLSKATTRALGIRLLNNYLDQCSTEVFTRTGNLWTSLVLKSCQGQQDWTPAYEALGKLVLKSLQTPELTKTFATTHLAKVYESLTNVSALCVVPALRCVETCLRLYPSSSGPSKRALDKFLARFHDSLDANVVSYTGKCSHLLQQVSGGEAQSANHKTLWKNYQTQLVGSIHEVFNDMFANCAEMWDDNVVQERLVSMDKLVLSPEPINKAAQMYVRCHNLINYLITALKEPFPVEKPLLPRMILGVISRGLGVNCNLLHQNPISDNMALSLLLPKIHLELLELLDVATVILRGHLLPYYNQILGLLMDVMKSTAEEEHYVSNQKPFRQLRAKVYDTTCLWCKVHNAGSRCEAIADHLLQEIFNDISPKSNELTLQVMKAVSKHTSKKLKRQLQKSQNDKSKIAQASFKGSRNLKVSPNDERNQLLCVAALRCLQAVLISTASFLKPTKIKLLQSSLIQICGNFYELPVEAAHLFSSAQCRLEIYNALYVLITTPHHLSPPPADIILAVLNNASSRDGNMKVRSHCCWILQNLEKVVHPQKESLVFPVDAREIRNTFIMMGQERLLASSVNGFSHNDLDNGDSDEEVEEIEIEANKEMGTETQKSLDVSDDSIVVINLQDKEPQPFLNKENDLANAPDSPQTVSDSEESAMSPPHRPVEISSGDESNPMKLRVDEDSEQDEVEIVSAEPFNKKPRVEETSEENGTTVGFEVKAGNETENKENDIADNENKTTENENDIVENVGNTSTDDIIMDMDEDALVDDIASQFVDDLA